MEATNTATSTGVTNHSEGTSQKAPLWETPSFVEIRMDAEIGSYQDDFDGEDWN